MGNRVLGAALDWGPPGGAYVGERRWLMDKLRKILNWLGTLIEYI